jgi:membrane protein DedA with SNARE-associated domain
VLPIACGAARLRLPIFLIGSAIASVVWATTFALVGWLFGETAMVVLGHIRRYEDLIAALLVVGVILVFVVIVRKRQVAALLENEARSSAPE